MSLSYPLSESPKGTKPVKAKKPQEWLSGLQPIRHVYIDTMTQAKLSILKARQVSRQWKPSAIFSTEALGSCSPACPHALYTTIEGA